MSSWKVRPLRVLLPPLALVAFLWFTIQFDATRRAVVLLFDVRLPQQALAAEPLRGTFDGADVKRPQMALHLDPVVEGVVQPTDLVWITPDTLVVTSKLGTAFLVTGGQPKPWFTVVVDSRSELGLLGLALHPDFANNGLFFVNVTPTVNGGPVTQIVRYRTDPKTLSPPVREQVLLEIPQPYANHDAGQIAFGPDGMLYIGTGDGGYRADPQGHGQNRATLLGAMLRIDVAGEEGALAYRIPKDNPFVGLAGMRPEIWAFGLRNPWRFTFDPKGRLVVADVGQDKFEEINLVRRGDNLGWNVREAFTCFARSGCDKTGLVDPIWAYPREDGVSVTGGVVGTANNALNGLYVFGDFGSGRLWALTVPDGAEPVAAITALGRFPINPSAFGRSPEGHIHVADFQRGAVFRLTPAAR